MLRHTCPSLVRTFFIDVCAPRARALGGLDSSFRVHRFPAGRLFRLTDPAKVPQLRFLDWFLMCDSMGARLYQSRWGYAGLTGSIGASSQYFICLVLIFSEDFSAQ
jgi:hypothetical protein